MTNEKMREEFEAWFIKLGLNVGRFGDEYIISSTEWGWNIWQAAHKAAVPDGYCVVKRDAWRDIEPFMGCDVPIEDVFLASDVEDILAGKLK